jgi:hypothetical protein
MNAKGYFIPEGVGFEPETLFFRNKFGEAEIEAPRPTRELAQQTIEKIELARENHLLGTPVRKIAESIGRASQNLSDKNYYLRKEAEETMPITTGLSPPMLSVGIDGLTRMFRKDKMLEMLYSELGNPEYLDGFRESKAGESRAFGKNLIVNVFGSGGVPGLQVIGIVNGLLIKSAVFSKPDSGEPNLPSIYLRAIADVDPKIAEAAAAFPWKGGSPEYADLEAYVFGGRGNKDAVVIYGSNETIMEVGKKVNPECKFIAYPPRTGLIMIGKEKLTKGNVTSLSRRAAMDVCIYDQKACFSPQRIYVEAGGEVSPEEFAHALSNEMDKLGKTLPVGQLTDYAKARINERKRTYQLQKALGNAEFFNPEGGFVVFDRNRALETPITYRTVHVMPVENLSEVPVLIKPFEGHIQAVGIEAGDKRFEEYSDIFSRIGDTSRITTPGNMYIFPPAIHHDGRRNYDDGLVRWVDRIKK